MRERWVALTTLAMLQVATIAAGTYAVSHEDFNLAAMTEQAPVRPEPAASPSVAPVITSGPVLAAGGNGTLPTKSTLASQLSSALGDKALGSSVGAVVIDVASGQQIFARNAAAGITPASTTKIVTSTAALASLGPDTRLTTSVVQGAAKNSIVLVGGGDPTLAGPSAKAGAYPKQASLAQLAQRTATALKEQGVTKVGLSFDDSMFTGPSSGPGWKPSYIPDGNVAPVSALMIDSGKANPSMSSPRVNDPASHAAAAFGKLLRRYGVSVTGKIASATAPPGSPELAQVQSEPVYALVERALTLSDNDLSEALARHVALKEGLPGSFEGGAQAVQKVLQRLGMAKGIAVSDGSGLSTRNRISADALARLVALASSPQHPELHAVVSGMPIAGFSGTLGNGRRFTAKDARTEAGLVRAKTGTLNNVNTLAGFATTREGRLVSFAFLADKVPLTAEPVLDRLAAIVARS
ncbi:D-alanyl-D-alanine carboxypeptidase/D-alanyl-D-alanine-endopeptidase [Nonomuraea sp. NPDC050663]|uniref:D-alanyl-D-alanine carboxypeptidase/D-alanyl-D-alanine endopeptidase n=1 Tax=Nonomuraea sp. NPDC050663 TaxID=3364370 RepID=UPI0037B454CE